MSSPIFGPIAPLKSDGPSALGSLLWEEEATGERCPRFRAGILFIFLQFFKEVAGQTALAGAFGTP
jgi:hypothetical protein